MQKLTATDPETQSPDIVSANLNALRALFPELATEGPDGVAVNIDVLKQLVGDQTVTDAEEKYGLNWHGKRRARQLALTPSTGTLRPCPEDSVDWDTTQNLMIEGDNLEVLKLLQKSYAGKVKLIYIDPPYNTGEDFVYPDNFQDNIKNYLELTGQIGEGGKKLSSNTEASGRFHTDWLNMMYPRLRLARNLLREDGVIFISIDDGEVASLRTILDEIFGSENFVANIVWQSRVSISDDHEISPNHNHTLVFARQKDSLEFHGEPLDSSEYSNPDDDSRGPWKLVPIDANKPGGDTLYPIRNAQNERDYYPPTGRSWAFNRVEFAKLEADGRIKFGTKGDSAPKKKLFLKERLAKGDTKTPSSILLDAGTTKNGTEETSEIMGSKGVFDYPKPVAFISRIVQYGCSTEGPNIVLDFFAGSGTTGHAVMARNATGNSDEHYILIQLPEALTPENKGQKVPAEYCDLIGKPRTIAELTKERLRRAGSKVRGENPLFAGDLGFRVFKLASSNLRAWEPDRDKLAESLEASTEHIKADRNEQDLLFEVLLKFGLDLCVPIERMELAGSNKPAHEIHSIGSGSLLVCLSPAIPQADVEPLALGLVAWHKQLKPAGETTVIFRDSAFADDVAKTNLTAILQQHGLETVRSL
jgi:adenine-specific DNA-methyltransferase